MKVPTEARFGGVRAAAPPPLTILGNKVTPADLPSPAPLETFPNPGVAEVTLEVGEGTSVCPVTGQPDFWTATITYRPSDRCLETKALKLYLWSFRDRPIFCEALATTIAADLDAALGSVAGFVSVTVRGGITITATAEMGKGWR
jgi:7-cyano-7-deazaguanine reductase